MQPAAGVGADGDSVVCVICRESGEPGSRLQLVGLVGSWVSNEVMVPVRVVEERGPAVVD